MPKRTVRVNELLLREISSILHTRYQAEAVTITITSVSTAPDLRQARVYYSVIGDDRKREEVRRFLQGARGDIRQQLGKVVVLKYLPALNFVEDEGFAKGSDLLDYMDEIASEEQEEEERDD